MTYMQLISKSIARLPSLAPSKIEAGDLLVPRRVSAIASHMRAIARSAACEMTETHWVMPG